MVAERNLRITITVVDRASKPLRDIHWRLWWWVWGTNGTKRTKALVVIPRSL